MNELDIKRHSFDLAKNRLKEFSEKTEAELAIDRVKTDGGFLGLGDHKVTGYELNNRLESIQGHLIDINSTNNKTIKELFLKTLKKQSEKITNFQQQRRTAKISKITIGDVVSKLEVPIISFSFDNESWESDKANLIMLNFYTQREFVYKMDNKINLHKIYIYIKNPVKSDVVLQLIRRNQGKWTKEVNDYFKDMEVESVKAN